MALDGRQEERCEALGLNVWPWGSSLYHGGSVWGANILGFNGVVLSVVDDVPVDSEESMVNSSISRICRRSI